MRLDVEDVLLPFQVVQLAEFGASVHAMTAALFATDRASAQEVLDRLALPTPEAVNTPELVDSRRAWKAYLRDLFTQAAAALAPDKLEDVPCRK